MLGDLAERDATAIGRGQQNVADGVGVLTELRLVADDEIEATVAVENLRGSDAADGRLHGGIDVGGHQSVTRRRQRDRWK